ncbi:uncharacterized protein LOC132696759 [Cylas formicarius]|uniref:uncharacterized protein LOC132696759 n=1 Tax=Cylas formicarius TaxID=197179 RepID=UPI002958A5C1|nr:uncharacterized protein LOC132696759 [Cylas formicarius]
MLIFRACAVLFIVSYVCGSFHQSSWQSVSNDYYHFDVRHPSEDYDYKPTRPMDIMVDSINDLGIKLLAIHNEHNEDNIAISPYGAVSVLAALSEGLEGDAAHEIIHAGHFPKDRHIVRVGLRDIHRHLKSYFIPQEGFLAGLTLNLNNVSLRKDYEEVLRFYGFDYGSFNNALYPEPPTTQKSAVPNIPFPPELSSATAGEINNATTVSTTIIPTTTELAMVDTESAVQNETLNLTTTTVTTSPPEDLTTTTIPPETTVPLIITTTSDREEMTTLNSVSIPTQPLTKTNPTTTDSDASTMAPTTNPFIATTTRQKEMPTELSTTTKLSESVTEELTTSTKTDIGGVTDVNIPETTISEENLNLSTLVPDAESTTTEPTNVPIVGTPQTFQQTESQFPFPESSTTPPPLYDEAITPFLSDTAAPNEDTTVLNPDFDYSYNYQDANIPVDNNGTFPQNYDEPSSSVVNNMISNPVPAMSARFNDNFNKRNARSVEDYVLARYYDRQHKNTQQPRPDPMTFLVYGKYRETGVNYMKYQTLLPFYFSPNLNSLALSFPLDSTRYYLLLLLPVDETGIDQLICDLRLHGSLKYIVENLKLSYVTASIPSFMLKGYVTLTPTLQQLGIRKVFEPRQADFSPMTNRSDIYVTNIEQAVTVTIRNYMDPSSESYKNLDKYDPVYFIADHPFLYFVLDSELHVTLMAGKVVNPLNSRIR